MEASSALLQLPVEVARVLVALLETDDLDQLAGVSRAAVGNSVFNPPMGKSLLLPPTDRGRVGQLLASILGRDPARLAGLAWIQVATPWHVEVLVESGVSEFVQRIRVRTEVDHSTETVNEICEKLHQLPCLTKLDMSDTSLRDLSSVAEMTQLRYISVNRTEISDAAPLAALVDLEELELLNTRVIDMSCIQPMTQLRRLEVTHRQGDDIVFPSLRAPSNLESLRVERISIASAANFGASLPKLKQLTVTALYARSVDGVKNLSRKAAYVHFDKLADYLPELEVIDDLNGADSARALSKISSLRVIRHKILDNFHCLAALQRLEELSLWLQSTPASAGRTDYRVLLTMPSLKKITIDILWFRTDPLTTAEVKAVLDVLVFMPQLEGLRLEPIVDSDIIDSLSNLRQLKHLSVKISPALHTLEWIKPLCHALRSLAIEVNSSVTDISMISCLTKLEKLRLINTATTYCGNQNDLPFLSQLSRLRCLTVEGTMRDLAPLRFLTKLRKLTIRSTSMRPMRNDNALRGLRALMKLDISKTRITTLSPLMGLTNLRSLVISPNADCRVLANGKHASLLRVLHPLENCMWSCSYGTIVEGEEIP